MSYFFIWLCNCFTQPFFRVVGKQTDKKRFFLHCLPSYYYFFAVGVMVILIPILASNALFFGIIFFTAIFVFELLRRDFLKLRADMTPLVTSYSDNNPKHVQLRKKLLISSMLFIMFIFVFSVISFFTAKKTNVHSISYLFFICFAVFLFCVLVTCCFSHYFLPIPELDAKYHTQLSETSKIKIDSATSDKKIKNAKVLLRGKSFIEAFHFSGTVSALFDGKNRANTMRSSKIKPVIWFFAPVLIPLFCLIAIPPALQIILLHFSVPICLDKYLLVYSSFCWLFWAFYYYTNKSDLDLFRKNSSISYYMLTRVADFEKIELQSMEQRETLLTFYQNQGLLILEVLSFAVIPFLFAYFSLFPET